MVRVTTWCRADLAGGTLDIWPIGLLHPGARTVNVALDLPVEVSWSPLDCLYRVIQQQESWTSGDLSGLLAEPETALVGEIVRATGLPFGEIRIDSGSPRGAGLGASSALAVALLAASELVIESRLFRTAADRAALARDLEARLMGLPTGLQDHYPGQLGGALEISHEPGGERVNRLDIDLEALGDRFLIAFTGQSHFSAGANWQIFRRRLEADAKLVANLDRIRDIAAAMPAALLASDWAEAGRLIGEEWRARRELSVEISTPAIETLLTLGTELGGWGGKAGGAGGGGCIFMLAPPERREHIVAAWTASGAQPLATRPTRRALEFSI